MYGFVESLNISVACAITLFCSTISASPPQRRSIGLSGDNAKNLKNESEQLLLKYKRKIEEAHTESGKIINSEKKETQNTKNALGAKEES